MFNNKVVVITGAGSGIGRALAVEIARRGGQLALSDISSDGLADTVARLPIGTRVCTYVLDVSSRDAVYRHAEEVVAHFGEVHYVINNAGTSVLATVEHATLDEIERVLAINLWGVIYGTKAFLPKMLDQREGCIVNVSSVFGLVATPCSAAYTISKFGVRGLTETLWQELEGTGVRAVLVHPGGINTNISKVPDAANESELERKLKAANVRQMTTTPEQCAHEIVMGLLRGEKRLLVGNGATALHWISRLFPNNYGALVRRKLGV
ncbi:SDR family oxidoreductase [Burkholderia sp. Bp8989]|nr:SDR family oxidoreductase [Burkholderia sp. Bp8995]RQS38927.1 SDR family oxidoreductase [Burkholderia sp. Bp8989]